MGFFNFPKVYYADFDEENDEAIIVMEDLRDSGHKMWNKMEPMDFQHSALLMIALGRLHALSFAMKAKNPIEFEKFKKLGDNFPILFDIDKLEAYIQAIIKDTLETLDSQHKEQASKILSEIKEVFLETTRPDWAEPFSVVTHGDCWSNNFLFHYGDKSLPDNIILLDWQISRYSSPAIDILYFFFISTDEKLRASHFNELTKIYHNSLEETLNNLEYASDKQFSFATLSKHLNKVGKYGVVTAALISSLVHTEKSDLLEIALAAKNNNIPFNFEGQIQVIGSLTKEKTVKKMRKVLIDAFNYGYL
jgi:Ecdysteroid kinase-like family